MDIQFINDAPDSNDPTNPSETVEVQIVECAPDPLNDPTPQERPLAEEQRLQDLSTYCYTEERLESGALAEVRFARIERDPVTTLAEAPSTLSRGHIAFYPPTRSEYYHSLSAIYRASWLDDVVEFRVDNCTSPGYRPGQFVCTTSDVAYHRPAANILPEPIRAVVEKWST